MVCTIVYSQDCTMLCTYTHSRSKAEASFSKFHFVKFCCDEDQDQDQDKNGSVPLRYWTYVAQQLKFEIRTSYRPHIYTQRTTFTKPQF